MRGDAQVMRGDAQAGLRRHGVGDVSEVLATSAGRACCARSAVPRRAVPPFWHGNCALLRCDELVHSTRGRRRAARRRSVARATGPWPRTLLRLHRAAYGWEGAWRRAAWPRRPCIWRRGWWCSGPAGAVAWAVARWRAVGGRRPRRAAASARLCPLVRHRCTERRGERRAAASAARRALLYASASSARIGVAWRRVASGLPRRVRAPTIGLRALSLFARPSRVWFRPKTLNNRRNTLEQSWIGAIFAPSRRAKGRRPKREGFSPKLVARALSTPLPS